MTNNGFCGVLTMLAAAVVLAGCSSAEIRQEFFGLDKSDVLSAERQYKKSFEADRDQLYDQVIRVLKDMKAFVSKKDKKRHFIAAIRFDRSFKACIDTTEVGILIRPADNGLSEVIVYSGNYALAAYAADRIFSQIEIR